MADDLRQAVIYYRLYRPSDRADLLRIGADTAFFGAPVEKYLEDRRLFCDWFYTYYTDVESAYCWVAEVEGKVVGFLAGCPDSYAKYVRWIKRILPGLFSRHLRGYYQLGPLTWRYLRVLLGAGLRGEAPHMDLRKYPAHLHINMDAAWRGQRLGQRLMAAYLDQLRSLGVRGVHVETTSMNMVACRMYEKVGFQLLDARPTRIWQGIIDHPIENLAYGMELVQR